MALFSHKKPQTRVLVLYATETGNSKEWAEKAVKAGKKEGFAVELACLNSKELVITEERIVLFATSSTGEGDLPPQGLRFLRNGDPGRNPPSWLHRLHFAVLGFGNSTYESFGGGPRKLDKLLRDGGGNRLVELTLCDAVEYDKGAEEWVTDIWKVVHEHTEVQRARKAEETRGPISGQSAVVASAVPMRSSVGDEDDLGAGVCGESVPHRPSGPTKTDDHRPSSASATPRSASGKGLIDPVEDALDIALSTSATMSELVSSRHNSVHGGGRGAKSHREKIHLHSQEPELPGSVTIQQPSQSDVSGVTPPGTVQMADGGELGGKSLAQGAALGPENTAAPSLDLHDPQLLGQNNSGGSGGGGLSARSISHRSAPSPRRARSSASGMVTARSSCLVTKYRAMKITVGHLGSFVDGHTPMAPCFDNLRGDLPNFDKVPDFDLSGSGGIPKRKNNKPGGFMELFGVCCGSKPQENPKRF